MGEALKDVILDQIAREDDAPVPPVSRTAESEIDRSFDALLSGSPGGAAPAASEQDLAEVQALFKQIAADYLGPVRDFMVEIGLGSASKQWLEVCSPAVTSLQKSAESMGLSDLGRALERLSTAFDEVERLPGDVIGDVARKVIENAHHDLERLLPEAFAIAEERDRREPIFVQTLLRQVPDVRKVALDKLYAAGLSKLEMYYMASAADLSEASGLSPELCQRVVDRFADFRKELASRPVTDGKSHEHGRLTELTELLENQTRDFEKAQAGARGLDKRTLRKARGDTLLEIQLVLARLGRVDLVEELEKVPFARKVSELRDYLARSKQGSGGT